MNTPITGLPIAADSLVLLMGQAGSGKSRLTTALFPQSSVLSSDAFRAMCSSPGDQTANQAAWQVLGVILGERLRRGLLTVVDATNSFGPDLADLIGVARGHGRPVVALVADVDLELSLARNAVRPDDRRVPEDVLADQYAQVAASLPTLHTEVDQVLYASHLPVLDLALRRMDADNADHRDTAEVLRTFGPAAALFDWRTGAVDGIRTGVFAAGGTHQVVRWVDSGDPFDAHFEARVGCEATPGCPGPAWTLVRDLATLAAAHAGQPDDEVLCDRCDTSPWTRPSDVWTG